MQRTLIVVDDLKDNADRIRDSALNPEYLKPPAAAYYSGGNSAQRVNLKGVADQILRVVGEPPEPLPPTGYGKFRLTLAGDEGRGDVHIDSQCHWSGISCLSRPGNRGKWQSTRLPSMKINWLVLFRPWFRHGTGSGFGTRVGDDRLIYLMFFRRVPSKGA